MVNDSSSPNMSGDQFSVEDLNRKLECKEEEVKLYKNKYESMSKQLVQLVSCCDANANFTSIM